MMETPLGTAGAGVPLACWRCQLLAIFVEYIVGFLQTGAGVASVDGIRRGPPTVPAAGVFRSRPASPRRPSGLPGCPRPAPPRRRPDRSTTSGALAGPPARPPATTS